MAATTLAEAINRTRRVLNDFGQGADALTASCTSSSTSVTVADATTGTYTGNWTLEIDQETLVVVSGTGTTLTVRRGWKGSTAASHASGATILIRPAFDAVQIIDAINQGVQACFPLVYKQVSDTTLTTIANTYEYTVPVMPSDSAAYMPYISRISLLDSGDSAYRTINSWDVVRGATPKIRFRRQQAASATIRVEGYGPFPLIASGGSFDTMWPRGADHLPSLYAASVLLASGEAARVRYDTGIREAREQANRTGSSMAAADRLLARFYTELDRAALPPLPRHVVSTI